jgi:periplasmic divalent cation tolerance protein
MSGEIVVFITCPPDLSESMSRTLVEERLAACVNIIGGIRSIYAWEEKICNDSEQLLVVKSNRSAWDKLCERVKQLHSYDVPEIVCLPIEDGYRPYLAWLNGAVGVRA